MDCLRLRQRLRSFPAPPAEGLSPSFTLIRPCWHFLRRAVSCTHAYSRICSAKIWAENRGLPDTVGLVSALALAPGMRISPHPAPTNRFRRIGDPTAWGLATPASIALARNRVALVGLAARQCARCVHIGGPPAGQGAIAALFTLLVLVLGDASHLRVSRRATPPSYDVVACHGYHVVDSADLSACMPVPARGTAATRLAPDSGNLSLILSPIDYGKDSGIDSGNQSAP